MRWLHTTLLSLVLAGLGLGIFLYKTRILQFPLAPRATEDVWTVEARLSFYASGQPAAVRLHIPRSTARVSILDESFISRGFGLTSTIEDGNRIAEWAIRRADGKQTLYYHAVVRPIAHRAPLVTINPPEIQDPDFEEAQREAALALLETVHRQSADMHGLVARLIAGFADPDNTDSQAPPLLFARKKTVDKRLAVISDMLALKKIPARVAHGIRLEDVNRDAPLVHWLEVHDGKSWIAFNGISGEPLIEPNLLPWWYGAVPLAETKGGSKLKARLSVNRRQEAALERELYAAGSADAFFIKFSLFSLPLETQAVYRVLLLVPVGGLLVALLRNVVGLQTFGTFMPVLIALAFREMNLIDGLVLFSLVVALGLAVRFYLDRLNLLLVPRLASILTVVVLILAFLSILTYHFHIEHGISIALFPMVILTMTIERMSIVWEELGALQAIKQGAGSLLAASLATILMSSELLEHLMFVFPELLLIVLAAAILLGRYTGYRLFELIRFRSIIRK